MNSINVLVTSIGGPVAQGILKGLKEMNNVRIIGADRRLLTAGNLFCDKVYQIPRFTDTKAYIARLKDLLSQEEISVLFPGHPMETELYTEYKEKIAIPVALPESPVYEQLLDKEAVYARLRRFGLGEYLPKYVEFTKNEDFSRLRKEHFPNESHIIVKEVKGYGALGVAVVTDHENYLKAVKNGSNKVMSEELYLEVADDTKRIIMEYLNKPEYSVDVFVHDREVVVAVPRQRTGVSNGLVLDGTIEKKEELLEAAEKISGKLVDNGFFNMQFMEAEDGFKLTDFNPRFCGSQVMSLGAGVNFPKLFIEYAHLGNRPVPEPIWGTRVLRYRETHFILPEENMEETEYKDFETSAKDKKVT